MKLRDPIDAARYSPRLLWLMLAGVTARFTVERSPVPALHGFLLSLAVLILCALVHLFLRRSRRLAVKAQLGGNILALLGIASGAMRLTTEDWLPAVFIALLAVQAGAFVAAARRLHVWVILVAAFAVLMCSAARSHSPLFLLCAACFTLIALDLLSLEQRDARERCVALAAMAPQAQRGGGLMFASVTLLLTVPVYLFVPKPGGWNLDELQKTEVVAPSIAAPPPASWPRSEPPAVPDAPSAAAAALIEISAHSARPDKGDYGEDFGIADVDRRQLPADDIVLFARSSHPINLRGRVYDRFTAARWSRSLAGPQRIELAGGMLLSAKPVGPTVVRQAIEVVRDLDTTLVHAPGVERLRFPATSLLRYDDGVLVAAEPLRAATVYSVESRLELRAGRYLLREPPPRDLVPYLQADGASARLRELARRVTASSPSALAKALALEQYLRTNYAYSYETIAQQNYTPLDGFLFDSKRGHCEFFASALAMLLRSVGIPSRVATGFALAAPNPLTGFYEVRALDGHAWVEAYLDDTGWLMLEPTPFYPLPVPEVGRGVAVRMDRYLERRAATRELLAPATLQTQLIVLTRDAWRGIRRGQSALRTAAGRLGWGLPLVLVAIGAGLLALYLLWIAATDWLDNLQIRRSLARLPRAEPRAATLLLAAALLRTTTARSLARRADWTLREYAQQLARVSASQDLPPIPGEFIEAFDAARYDAATAPGSTQSLSQVTAQIRERLRRDPWPRLSAALNRLRRKLPRHSTRGLEGA